MNFSITPSIRLAVAAAVTSILMTAAPASAAPPSNAELDFTGSITSVARQGNHCRYTATLDTNVQTSMGGTPDGFTVRLRARWIDDCPQEPADVLISISGTADARLRGITTEMGGNPDGFRFTGTATNVQTTMDGNPDGFRFTGRTGS